MVDGVDRKDEDGIAAEIQILKQVRYKSDYFIFMLKLTSPLMKKEPFLVGMAPKDQEGSISRAPPDRGGYFAFSRRRLRSQRRCRRRRFRVIGGVHLRHCFLCRCRHRSYH